METAVITNQYTADRSVEAERITSFLLSGAGKRLAILYGQRGSRRRELIREWVMPRLAGRRDAFYGDCEAELPQTVSGPAGEFGVEEALRRGGLVFLGRMERCFPTTDRGEQRDFAELLRRVEEGDLPGWLVLTISDRSLGQVLPLKSAAPSLMANMLEIAAVTFRDSLESLSPQRGASGLRYTPEAVDLLAEEAQQSEGADGAELAWAVDQGFFHYKLDANRYRNGGRLEGDWRD